jgi:hypothetical protein
VARQAWSAAACCARRSPIRTSATIIEDRGGGSDDDIWFAADWNKDGDLLDPGEGLARWASNGTIGSEFTGLYFDFRNPNRAYVNIQHPASGVDRLIEISAAPHLERGNK